ncbi:MAG: GGDEF domain-containing response regulator [Neptuniibacter sp.]
MHVLIIDDDQSICDFMKAIVTEEGHSSYTAQNYNEAFQILSEHDIDLVFVDVYLPGKDGFEFTEDMRKKFDSKWVPVVFISGSDSDENYKRGVDVGGDDYLVKPIRPIIVKTKLKTLERIALMKQQVDDANLKLKKLTHQDPLTKVHNRRYLQHVLLKEWRSAQREDQSLTVLMIDIDYFKNYNDQFGHIKGDTCLQKIAKCITSAANRPRDVVARYGGEEFLVVLPDTSVSGAHHIAEKIQKNVFERGIDHPASEVSDKVTLSIGISSIKQGAKTSSELCDQADKVLYLAKTGGRNRIECYERPGV